RCYGYDEQNREFRLRDRGDLCQDRHRRLGAIRRQTTVVDVQITDTSFSRRGSIVKAGYRQKLTAASRSLRITALGSLNREDAMSRTSCFVLSSLSLVLLSGLGGCHSSTS